MNAKKVHKVLHVYTYYVYMYFLLPNPYIYTPYPHKQLFHVHT